LSKCTEEKQHNAGVLQDLLRFYAFAFLLQLLFFVVYAAKVSEHPTSTKVVVDRVINIFISAAPTGAPTVVVAGIAYCVVHLRNQEVVVLLPDKIKTIADVEVVCFDKTGTLTGTMVSSSLVAGQLCPLFCPVVRSTLPTCCLVAGQLCPLFCLLQGQPCLLLAFGWRALLTFIVLLHRQPGALACYANFTSRLLCQRRLML